MPLAKYDTFWQRLWAGVIDALVLAPLGLGSWFFFSRFLPKWLVLVWAVVFYISQPLYSILMHGRCGQTVGKRAMDVVVLDASEQRLPTYRQAFLRDIVLVISKLILLANFVRVVLTSGYVEHIDGSMGQFGYMFAWAGEIWFWLEVVTMLANPRRRALHDWIASTVVVDEGSVPMRIAERLAGSRENAG